MAEVETGAWRHLDIIAIVKRKGNRMLGSDSGDRKKWAGVVSNLVKELACNE